MESHQNLTDDSKINAENIVDARNSCKICAKHVFRYRPMQKNNHTSTKALFIEKFEPKEFGVGYCRQFKF